MDQSNILRHQDFLGQLIQRLVWPPPLFSLHRSVAPHPPHRSSPFRLPFPSVSWTFSIPSFRLSSFLGATARTVFCDGQMLKELVSLLVGLFAVPLHQYWRHQKHFGGKEGPSRTCINGTSVRIHSHQRLQCQHTKTHMSYLHTHSFCLFPSF